MSGARRGSWGHLARRFIGALNPAPPSAADERWVAGLLTPEELALWRRQPGHDRRHTVAVARRLESGLAGGPHAGEARWLACALLHDIGKLDSGLGVPGRVAATLAGAVLPPARRAVLPARTARYLDHPRIGAAMIRGAGGRAEPAAWAAAHHGTVSGTVPGIPPEVAAALVEADDD